MVSPLLPAAAPSPLDHEAEFNKTVWHFKVPFEACCLSLWEQRVKREFSWVKLQLSLLSGLARAESAAKSKIQQFVLGSALIQFLVPAYCSPVGQRVLWFLTCHAWARAPLLGFWKSQYRSRGGFPGRSSPPVGGAAFCTFLQFQGKVLASAAGNIFAKKRRLKTSRFLPPLPKALENNFKEEHPPSMQSAKHPFVGSQTRPMKWGRDIFFDHLLLRQTRG